MRRVLAEVAATLILGVVALSLVDFAQQAWLLLPPAAVLAALCSLRWRLRHRAGGRRLTQRLLTAGPPLALLLHLPSIPADLPRDLGGPRWVLALVPGICCVLLVVRALALPARSVPFARSAAAALLSGTLLANWVTFHDVLPSASPAVRVRLPVQGEWLALQAGRNLLTNHHTLIGDQGHAVDLVRRLPGGSTRSGPRGDLASYGAYGQRVLAPADGVVVAVVNDRPDEAVGGSDSSHPSGNAVTLQLSEDRFVLVAHLRRGSVAVRVGERVRAGDLIGTVGNSGNTSEPHLHIQAMTALEGGRPVRLQFTGVLLRRDGKVRRADGVELRRNDRVVPVASSLR